MQIFIHSLAFPKASTDLGNYLDIKLGPIELEEDEGKEMPTEGRLAKSLKKK